MSQSHIVLGHESESYCVGSRVRVVLCWVMSQSHTVLGHEPESYCVGS